MGNGVSIDQGNLPSHGKTDVRISACKGQHDWSQLAKEPETHSLSTDGKTYSYDIVLCIQPLEIIMCKFGRNPAICLREEAILGPAKSARIT